MVAVRVSYQLCGGTLISPDVVLAAGKCFCKLSTALVLASATLMQAPYPCHADAALTIEALTVQRIAWTT